MTFVSLRFGNNQTEYDIYHHRGAYGPHRQQHIDDANHRRVQPQVFAQASTHAANHAPLTRPGKSFDHIRRNLVGDRLSRACRPDSASAVPKLRLPPQFIAKIEQSKGKNKMFIDCLLNCKNQVPDWFMTNSLIASINSLP